ncbi:MAG: hypothetical protein WDM94_01345 [Bauldia sp.]
MSMTTTHKDRSPETEILGLQTDTPETESVGVLSGPVNRLAAELAGLEAPTAPIQLPSKEELTVRLVNISLLQRLDELRGDVTLLQTIFWTIAGGLLGLITTLFGSVQSTILFDKAAGALLVLLTIFLGLFGFLWRRASKRADEMTKKIFEPDANR